MPVHAPGPRSTRASRRPGSSRVALRVASVGRPPHADEKSHLGAHPVRRFPSLFHTLPQSSPSRPPLAYPSRLPPRVLAEEKSQRSIHESAYRRRGATPACRSGGRPPQDLLKSFSIAPLLLFSTPGQSLLIPNISSSGSVLSEIPVVQIACWNLMENFLTKCSVESDLG
ncbi:hypothetical protein VPH35_083932 [Triticum aestivum]